MYELEIRETFRAPIAKVFEALSDHEQFFRGHGVARAVVTTPGTTEKNGLGAVRTIDALGMQFTEEVTRFERPARFDYQIRSVTLFGRPLPMRHELGWLELSETTAGTVVVWRTRFTFEIPWIGERVARLASLRLKRGFRGLLRQAKGELERARSAA